MLGGRPEEVAAAETGGDDVEAEKLWPSQIIAKVLDLEEDQPDKGIQAEKNNDSSS